MAFEKVTVLGGGSARTPLLIHGIAEARAKVGIREVALYDTDRSRVELIAALGREVARRLGSDLKITTPEKVGDAVTGAKCVISSLRVGGGAARARDEEVARNCGFAGQETTGPGRNGHGVAHDSSGAGVCACRRTLRAGCVAD
jgi:6-phospho-beta-glucosidase